MWVIQHGLCIWNCAFPHPSCLCLYENAHSSLPREVVLQFVVGIPWFCCRNLHYLWLSPTNNHFCCILQGKVVELLPFPHHTFLVPLLIVSLSLAVHEGRSSLSVSFIERPSFSHRLSAFMCSFNTGELNQVSPQWQACIVSSFWSERSVRGGMTPCHYSNVFFTYIFFSQCTYCSLVVHPKCCIRYPPSFLP